MLQVINNERRIESLTRENRALGDRVQLNAQDILHLQQHVQQLELDLTISQEKHRTCQQEVGQFINDYLTFCLRFIRHLVSWCSSVKFIYSFSLLIYLSSLWLFFF